MLLRLKTVKQLAAITTLILTATANATIYNVPGDYATIQEAIAAVKDGDEIVVAPGTYNETINFLGKAITVHSSGGAAVTTIDGTGLNTSVVSCISQEGADTVLEGFTITGGNAVDGGGMYNFISSPTVTNCTFSGNVADFAGGGMYNSFSNPSVTNCTFNGNVANFGGGGMYNLGGIPTVTNCTFNVNSAINFGGGMWNEGSSPTVTNCKFSGNSTDDGGTGIGGGIFNWDFSHLTLINCTFTGNFASVSGGGMANFGASVATVINCTLSGNTAEENGGGIRSISNFKSDLTVTSCILWGNKPSEIVGLGTVSYSNVQGGWAGAGTNNIDADPMFFNPGSGDYRLMAGSLCIDAADNTAVPKGIDTDLGGNPRFVDDPDTKDTGNGDPPIVDMGAYELQVTSCPWDLDGSGAVGTSDLLALFGQWGSDGPADFDGSGVVDTSDLLILFANWGPCT